MTRPRWIALEVIRMSPQMRTSDEDEKRNADQGSESQQFEFAALGLASFLQRDGADPVVTRPARYDTRIRLAAAQLA